ncbi:MAG: DNA polymerase III subunit gamma and tau, partial [Bifidobacteriaceae bacterium]|nr:DNA polymerase III subunit gamma and tau [Bifidobacteriaceae bacterium]
MNQALYRRYRPQTFGEVIGQEHVTEPLMQALRTGRVSHAYLFSGPRGCGKTTCARILARCLNCEKGPTPEPCGECASCQELGRGGSGSLDVVEIDAASHGGVDDTRDLREKAVFAPARDRYKVFVLDEAHMVSREGFNALLKIVEEPPPHVKFIFATTEPNKVLPTIRSRSHHYPFRLVPPGLMTSYMEELSQAEGVEVAPGVMQMVVRAGGGSVRDTESVLDQLIGGSVDGRVTYERASALLGFTPDELIGQMVSALGRGDGASMFAVIESVVESGLEPHRFAEDLLERLRDLIVLAAAGPSARQALRGLPEDQVAALAEQAAQLGLFRLTRAADSVSAGLASMAGATSPRLHLELLAARALMAAQPPQQGLAQVPDAVRSPSQQPPPASAPAGQRGPGAPPARGQAPHPPEGAPGVSATFSRGTAPHRPADASGPGEAGTEPGGRGQPQRAGAPLAPGSPGQAGGPPRGGSAPADGWAIPGVTTGAAWAESDRSRRPAGRRSDGHGPESAGQAAQAGPAIPHPTHPDQRGAGAAPGPQTARPIRQFVDWDEPEAAPPPRSPQSGAAGPGQPGEREQRGQSGQPLRPGEPGEPDPGGQSRRPARAGRSAGPGDPARTQPPLGPGQTPGLRADGPIPPRPASAPPDAQTRVRPQATSDHPVGAPGPSNAPAAHNQSARGDQAAGPVGSRPAPAAPVAEGEQERWRQLLEQVRHHSVAAHGLLSHSARPMGAGQGQLKLVFPTPDLASAFTRRFHALVEQA